jgi:hypothetical protein
MPWAHEPGADDQNEIGSLAFIAAFPRKPPHYALLALTVVQPSIWRTHRSRIYSFLLSLISQRTSNHFFVRTFSFLDAG